MKNKVSRGTTLVEIMISISLVSIVLIFLMNILIELKSESNLIAKTGPNSVNRSSLTQLVQNDFNNKGLKKIEKNDNNFIFTFNDNSTKSLIINENKVNYDDEQWKFSKGTFDTSNIKFSALEGNCYNNIYIIQIPFVTEDKNNLDLEFSYNSRNKVEYSNNLCGLGSCDSVAFDDSYCTTPVPEEVPEENISFATSSWSDIVAGYKVGNIYDLNEDMREGTTRDVDLGSLGVHQVRIANLTPCSTANTVSQSACGLVIEFADTIFDTPNSYMNNYYNDGLSYGDAAKGGWEYSRMRAYLNNKIYAYGNIDFLTTGVYSKIPSELKNLIIDTKVVSGYSLSNRLNDSNNFTTIDKLYLFSRKEVWNYTGDEDTASGPGITRQLDYYMRKRVTEVNYSGAAKNVPYFLRSVKSPSNYLFDAVTSNGAYSSQKSDYLGMGISPAFRLAD